MNTPPEHVRAIANLESVGCKWEASVLRRLHAANVDCLEHFNAIKAERDELLDALKVIASGKCAEGEEAGIAAAAIAKATA